MKIICIVAVLIVVFVLVGWYVMNKIDAFMNKTRRLNDKETMNAILNNSDNNDKKDIE